VVVIKRVFLCKEWVELAFSRESMYLEFWDSDQGRLKEREERLNQLFIDLRDSM